MKTSISITRALVELKRLNDRITNAVNAGKFVSHTIGKGNYRKLRTGSDTVAQMTQKIQASFDTVESLIKNRQVIKSAIVMSNATTKVELGGKTYSVAEAIELKSTVEAKTQYLMTLRKQLLTETTEVEKLNNTLEQSIDVSLNSIYGAEKSKIDENTYKSIAAPQKEQKEAELLDPQKIVDRIAALSEEISLLKSEVDFVLSESNARTMIEVDM